MVCKLLEDLAVPMLVLILDDLHVADEGSIDLLARLLRQPPRGPVLFVLGYRDQQADAALRAAIDGSLPGVPIAHVHLGPLSEDEVGQILANQGIASWRRQIYEDSWGNPAYLRALISEQVTFPGRMAETGMEQVARSGNYAVFLGELDGVSEWARTVAEAAAVVGADFDAELVARMLDRPESEIFDAIGELISRDLIHPVARGPYFAFRHPVVHRAVYYGSELSVRVRLHVRADDILRERGAAAVLRAPHVEQWSSHGDLAAVDVFEEASSAVSGIRPVTAASWLAAALRLLPHQPRYEGRRAQLLLRLAKARGVAGDLRECRDLMHEVLRIMPCEPPGEHAKAVAFTAMVQRLLGAHPETAAMLRAEIEALGENDPAGRAALIFELAARELHGDGGWSECRRSAREALRLAEESGGRSRQLACHGLIAKASVSGGDMDAAAEHLERATAILDGMLDGDFTYSLDAVVWVGWSDALLERWDDALRHFGKAVEFAMRTGRQLALPHLLVGQVFALYNTGRLAESQAAAENAVYLAQQSGSPEQLISAYSMLAWTDVIMGRMDRGLESILVATDHIRGGIGGVGGVGGFEALALRMLAEAKLLAGDPEGCLALVPAVGGAELPATDACSRMAWYELLTRAELSLGRAEAAAKWAEAATSAATLLNQPGRNGLAMLSQAVALLATEPEAALPSAERAVSSLTAAGMTVDAYRARVILAKSLWHHGRYDDATREVKDAQLGLNQLGAVTLSQRARTERRRLAALASKAKLGVTGEPDRSAVGLTDRERQIAELVREGLTNRLIAKRLHISEKTVEMHLSKVFAKLGVANRAAVAVFVTREQSADVG